ncbi:MAG: putative membrane protein [Halobacteriales archaeon]|jgi:uncharacterized membrane protein
MDRERPVDSGAVTGFVRRSLLTGAAIVLPVLVTIAAVSLGWSIIVGFLAPFVDLLGIVPGADYPAFVLQLLTAGGVLLAILVVGAVAERRGGESRVSVAVDHFMSTIPGVSTIYTSAQRLGDVIVENDAGSFRDVVLVEFPIEGIHMLAFVTAEPHEEIQTRTDAEVTLFLPLSPNPVMGGFLINVSEDRLVDVDMSVDEGISAVMTSGVAVGDTVEGDPLSTDDVERRVDGGIDGDVIEPGSWSGNEG